MDFQDIEVGYRRTKNIMEGDLTRIIEKLKILYKPDKERYGVKIIFKEINPYFGLYLKKLNLYDVDAFKVSFHLQEDRVKVNKNSIEINSSSFDSLKTNAKSYLTLSPSR